ncbi:MAG: hypothetical protein A3H96_14975 [Acidobacteria bacterium RIFCSPLOWO2_02_FULL_67_36]|nr:MAG: hypothetical protein A3H96_14975 [Acidobacteria bacterium RIFCSPLOWO2_02_FULL_67_36]OFW19286.1 MAG: hypothetical protein A3G21_02175 [Acidobacteria bacterium RIFCSPLOWO2_12_FULL_66_21]
MHVGTFTSEGTWAAAAAELPELKALGVTVIEMMPVADFPGRFGWGYDGVNLYAPSRLYGAPDELRAEGHGRTRKNHQVSKRKFRVFQWSIPSVSFRVSELREGALARLVVRSEDRLVFSRYHRRPENERAHERRSAGVRLGRAA